ncbi:DNA-directed RNA polymerase I subunit RPA2 isoform X2 [Folsomia candida]|uniref:DNA-directed RNA polymerase I subunit RPA2 isoform X2 n=1 Tax=Folsomia candida TaxID=158441 RepID=UPI001604E850|nr:DNA-directed RNA polymerase I subunit RPA2 isoform X2 [Folsomia candida]
MRQSSSGFSSTSTKSRHLPSKVTPPVVSEKLWERIPKHPRLTQLKPEWGRVPKVSEPALDDLGSPHIRSFNWACNEGLKKVIKELPAISFELPSRDRITLSISDARLTSPKVPNGAIGCKDYKVYPTECRQRYSSYKGDFYAYLTWWINGSQQPTVEKCLGPIPVMVKSKLCNLHNLAPPQLVEKGEHETEWGGYFIVKGHEKLIRMLLMTRANYPIYLLRSSWESRGKGFTDKGVLIRCVREDRSYLNNVLHYLSDGGVKLMFNVGRELFFVPLMMIMKALVDVTDEFIYKQCVAGYDDNLFMKGCIIDMLRDLHRQGVHSHHQAKEFIGEKFESRIHRIIGEWKTSAQCCEYLLEKSVAIQCDAPMDKFHFLVFAMQKLYCGVQDMSCPESPDHVMTQEVLLGGHLYLQIIKDKLLNWLTSIQYAVLKKCRDPTSSLQPSEMGSIVASTFQFERNFEAFIATGNVPLNTGQGLPQVTGLTIVVENLNRLRYLAHFRSVHRGAFFQELRTTDARQLQPDAWGFICPVHTPDGAPCGLLNHLSAFCRIVTETQDSTHILGLLISFGMTPIGQDCPCPIKECYKVILDGKILGYIPDEVAKKVVDKMRLMKIKNDKVTTHQEINEQSFLSHLANLIPMPDNNQSPRNMYQCQMGKQTMGTPYHTYHRFSENKLYRLYFPGTPFFRPAHYDYLKLDDYPSGTNAIVAVISYTGYDMEDAMIISKSAFERGFGHGCIYKSEHIDLKYVLKNTKTQSTFMRDPLDTEVANKLGPDGLPYIGVELDKGDPYFSFFNAEEGKYVVKKFGGMERVYVDNIKLKGNDMGSLEKSNVVIVFRVPKNPRMGDKFASRAGQKGICSYLWPSEDLPFTESGLIPDIVFNPHGFPSRMTIAMMIEILAGKGGALHGLVHDATPFKFSEDDSAIDYFGKLLEKAGYNYYGTERMYSGTDGRELTVDIFFGIVHYQRLRHMVSEKWQVRSTGPIDSVTHQPNKGRRRGGGVRFGEMEKDCLLSHGASYLLQDRLFYGSDRTTTQICLDCGSIVSPIVIIPPMATGTTLLETPKPICSLCGKQDSIEVMEIPYVFKYLTEQLASVNIKLKLDVQIV